MDHFNRPPRRKAEFIKPPNTLKAKVGSGGLAEEILDKAQKLLEDNTLDFPPLGFAYLENMAAGIETAKRESGADDPEALISGILYPALQLKAHGGMFHYPLVTRMADQLIQFLEVIEDLDTETIEIIMAFHSAIKVILQGRVSGDGGQAGADLLSALTLACVKYFERRPPVIAFL